MNKPTGNQTKKEFRPLRREVLIGSGCVAGLLLLGATSRFTSANPLIRPPGAVKEDFLSKCLKCGRCVAICPSHAIASAGIIDGFTNQRTPVMDYLRGYCDFCGKCIEVCPSGALLPFEGETTVIGTARINKTCIAMRTGGCTKCHEACPYDAITLDQISRPIIDEEKCNGCGKCVNVCPAHVFQSFSSGDELGVSVHTKLPEENAL